jgi:carboxyl-terminal processing protease
MIKKKRNLFAYLVLTSVLCLLVLAGTKTVQDYFEITKNMELFGAVYKEVNLKYVDEPNPGELSKKGIDAMLSSLDPYTNYFTESEAEDALIRHKGELGNPGFSAIWNKNAWFVSQMADEGPARKSGMKIGDKILSINGRPAQSNDITLLLQSLEGAVGTKVEVKVQRKHSDNLSFELTREKYKAKDVTYFSRLENDYGYIRLDQFMQTSGTEVKTAFETLRDQGPTPLKGVILDLRNNGGGLLIESVRILSLFLPPNQLMVVTKGRSTEHYREYHTFERPMDLSIPIVVLINENSASASEIVSGALQDKDRAVVVGRNSFGKGLVQNQIPLPYRHQMKITIAKYYIPSGRCIQLLDYSKRNPDGSLGTIPDSLRKAFKTKNGRTVYEGAGIAPDIEVKLPIEPEIVKAIKKENYLFDFVSDYCNKNPYNGKPEDFKITNAVFAEFETYLNKVGLEYKTTTDEKMEEVMIAIKSDKYEQDLSGILNGMKSEIRKAKENDLLRHKDLLMKELEQNMAIWYFGNEGAQKILFRYDNDVIKGIDLLKDKSTYTKVLSPAS